MDLFQWHKWTSIEIRENDNSRKHTGIRNMFIIADASSLRRCLAWNNIHNRIFPHIWFNLKPLVRVTGKVSVPLCGISKINLEIKTGLSLVLMITPIMEIPLDELLWLICNEVFYRPTRSVAVSTNSPPDGCRLILVFYSGLFLAALKVSTCSVFRGSKEIFVCYRLLPGNISFFF